MSLYSWGTCWKTAGQEVSDVLWSVLCGSEGVRERGMVCTGGGLHIDIKISKQIDTESVCNCVGNTVIVLTVQNIGI